MLKVSSWFNGATNWKYCFDSMATTNNLQTRYSLVLLLIVQLFHLRHYLKTIRCIGAVWYMPVAELKLENNKNLFKANWSAIQYHTVRYHSPPHILIRNSNILSCSHYSCSLAYTINCTHITLSIYCLTHSLHLLLVPLSCSFLSPNK